MKIQFWGATEEVTGSCLLVQAGRRTVLIDCGMFQGGREEEARNRQQFPFEVNSIDAVILSHAHIDHSGRLPLLLKAGFKGKIYTHKASKELCNILLQDSAYLLEKDTEIENRKRSRKGLSKTVPLYTRLDAGKLVRRLKGLEYDERCDLYPEISFRLQDAGHILGSAIVEIWLREGGRTKKLTFSGDLGHMDIPILRNPTPVHDSDVVIMETTYGSRCHRPMPETINEIGDIVDAAGKNNGNILIPAFAVGRSQELLYLFAKYYKEWQLDKWRIFLDSPMAIATTDVYLKYQNLYDEEAYRLLKDKKIDALLPGLHISHTANQSMQLNKIQSGAIIIAGSGMCTGGRIKHHLKHNIWRRACHIMIVGFQARGTLGRSLVDGTKKIRLWGETMSVNANIHTVGGLSAHADQSGLLTWYRGFANEPKLFLVHGERDEMNCIYGKLGKQLQKNCLIPAYGDEAIL